MFKSEIIFYFFLSTKYSFTPCPISMAYTKICIERQISPNLFLKIKTSKSPSIDVRPTEKKERKKDRMNKIKNNIREKKKKKENVFVLHIFIVILRSNEI